MEMVYLMISVSEGSQKITLLISTLGGGGAERVCVILANGLAQLGWQVDLVILKHAGYDRSSKLSEKVRLVCLNVDRARYAPKALLRYLNDYEPAIVLSFNNEVVIAEFLVSLIRKRTYKLIHRNVTTLSSVVYHSGGGFLNKFRYWFLRKVLRHADMVVSQCELMAKDASRELGIGDIPYIYNPVDPKSAKGSVSTPESDDGNFILCVGRIDENKSIGLAVEALAILSNSGMKTELWIAGEGPEKDSVALQVKQLGLQSQVRFLGYRQDIEELFNRAVLVSLTSNFEGFPNVLVEAISHGCPIVSIDCPSGPSEIVKEGINGVLVKERTPNALADAYAATIAKDWDREAITQTAERFSQERILRQWQDLLSEQLIARAKTYK